MKDLRVIFMGTPSFAVPVLNKLIEEINKPDMTFNEDHKPKIVTAQYKNDAGIIGATIDN